MKINNFIYDLDSIMRLDIFLKEKTGLTRSYIKTLIEDGFVLLGNQKVKAGYMLKNGDIVSLKEKQIETISAEPENIPLDIIYEDKDLIVINKQVGLVVHPCSTTKSHTLVNALIFHIKDLSTINGVLRPGIVHRLDKDTGGLMIVAKNDNAHKKLAEQLKDKTLNREYKALIKGRINTDFVVEGNLIRNPKYREQMMLISNKEPIFIDNKEPDFSVIDSIKGKYSKTIFSVDKVYDHYTLLNCKLTTGRTHQIRAHLKSVNHPIVGDNLYGGEDKSIKKDGQLLFAYKIEFVHPSLNKLMCFEAELPDYFQQILDKISV